jgi:hypothetical protein
MMLAQVVSQSQTIAQTGIGIGSAIAIVCSWQRNGGLFFVALRHLFRRDS